MLPEYEGDVSMSSFPLRRQDINNNGIEIHDKRPIFFHNESF